MEKPDHIGDSYWLAIIAGTVAYDYWALSTHHETASASMRRHTEQPWQKFLLIGAMGGLALHFLSERYDPANLIFGRENHEAV